MRVPVPMTRSVVRWLTSAGLVVVSLGLAWGAHAQESRILDRGGSADGLLEAPGDGQVDRRPVTHQYGFVIEESGERWTFDLESDVFDAYLYLLDDEGEVIGFDDDGGEGLNSRLFRTFQVPGSYVLVVTSFGGRSEGPYRLRSRSRGVSDGSADAAPPLPRDGSVEDLLVIDQSHDPFEHRMITRRHPFEANAGEVWEFYLGSDAFDAYLYLLDEHGQELARDDDGGAGLDSRIVWTAPRTATYTLVVTSFGGSSEGPYELRSFIFEQRPMPRRPLTLGERIEGGFGPDHGRDAQGLASTSWTFDIEQPTRLQIEISGLEWSTYVRLVGPMLQEIEPEGGSYLEGVVQLQALWPGEYRLVFLAPTASHENWTIRVSEISALEVPAARPIRPGSTADGVLEPGSRAQGDRWTFRGEAGDLLVADLRSSDFDAYLYLLDPSGILAHEDDDGGAGLDSRIVYRLTRSGTWTLVATSYGSREEGAYELELRTESMGRLRPRRLRPGRTIERDLSEPDYWDPEFGGGPVHVYRLRGRPGQRLHVQLEGENVAWDLMDPSGYLLNIPNDPWLHDMFMHDMFMHGMGDGGYGDLFGEFDEEFLDSETEQPLGNDIVDLTYRGVYLLHVRTFGDPGPYTLRVDRMDTPEEEVLELVPGETLSGAFTERSTPDLWGGFRQHVTFTVDEPARINLRIADNDVPISMMLTRADDPQAMPVGGEAQLWEVRMHPELDTVLLPGRYVITLRQDAMQRTAWSLHSELSTVPDTPGAGSISINEQQHLHLDGATMLAPSRQTPAIPVRLTLDPGEPVRVTMRSTDFDAYLVMVSEDGLVAAFDDDSGGNLDARFEYTSVHGGEYIIFATSFGGSTAGRFTLSVESMEL